MTENWMTDEEGRAVRQCEETWDAPEIAERMSVPNWTARCIRPIGHDGAHWSLSMSKPPR